MSKALNFFTPARVLVILVISSICLYQVWIWRPLTDAMVSAKSHHLFDVLTADIKLLQDLLASGSITSVDLIEAYFQQIRKHDGYLHAMLSMPHLADLKRTARQLDKERDRGQLRSPLHGIPIIVKDTIASHPNLAMNTTGGSLALLSSRPRKNAKILDMLLKAGLIVMGKTNLSEFSNFKGRLLPSGWSAVGGQTQSAYVKGGLDPNDSKDGHSSPSGSSTGSAVGVSAGYAPFSIGSETDGSLVCPSGRAALYTIKSTIGLVPQAGLIPVSHTMDSPGPMAKTPYDLALLLDAITQKDPDSAGAESYTKSLVSSWSEISIAAVHFDSFLFGPEVMKPVEEATVQMRKEYNAALDKIKQHAKAFYENVPLISVDELHLQGNSSKVMVQITDFSQDLPAYLRALDESDVRTLKELVEFNRNHADRELPPGHANQAILEDAAVLNVSPEQYESHFKHMREVGRKRGIDYILQKYNVDVIIGPNDSTLSTFACVSSYPIATLPLGYLDFNGRPFGLLAFTTAHQDSKLIKVQSAWEATFGPRKPPPLLS